MEFDALMFGRLVMFRTSLTGNRVDLIRHQLAIAAPQRMTFSDLDLPLYLSKERQARPPRLPANARTENSTKGAGFELIEAGLT